MNLIESIFRGDVEAVRIAAKQSPAEIEAPDEGGRSPLMHATIDKKVDIVLLLLEAGADPNAQDGRGNSPLHFATQGHDPDVASCLIANGAKVDLVNENGNSPLFNAVFNSRGHGELIALLIESGANKDLKNAHGVSPSDLAATIGNYDVAKFFG